MMSKSKPIPLQAIYPEASQLVYGCMGLGGGWNSNPISSTEVKQASEVIDTALDVGINVFDHADIYTLGKAEQVFGKALQASPELREKMIIQSKCAIRFNDDAGPKRYDFSAEWITDSVHKSLAQLHTDYLDILLLHRPDPLMDLEEVVETLSNLVSNGKIRQLGVSNMHTGQIALLQSALNIPIVANQIEMSLAHIDWLESGITTNTNAGRNNSFDTGLLEYCQINNIQIQAWGSLAQGKITSSQLATDARTKAIVKCVEQYAGQYQCSTEAIALAWLSRLPMGIQPIIGTTNLNRIRACSQAHEIFLEREHWYQLYEVARGSEMP
jgi:predicted oxidoreductase